MKPFGPSFFWVLGGIPRVGTDQSFEYYIIPADVMAHHVAYAHDLWLKTPGKHGKVHQDNKVRIVHLPPYKSLSGWDISEYKNRWELIADHLDNFPAKTVAPATDEP